MSHAPVSIRVLASLRQACRAVVGCLIIVASLFVFPNAIPWLIAVWLLGYTLLVRFGRFGLGLLCLGSCAAVLVAKRLTPAPGLLGLLVVMVVIILLGIVHLRRSGKRRQEPSSGKCLLDYPQGPPPKKVPDTFCRLSVLALWIAWGGMSADWHGAAHCRHPVTLRADRPVVCLGDSMTSLGLFGGYPRDLQKLISLPVVNLGIGGISASEAVEYLPELIRHAPQVVVIELGGHDFLRGYSRASTKANLKTIIDAVRQIGAEAVLMEIPRAYISDPYWGLEREIAREENVELVPDTAMRTIFLRSSTFPPGSWLGEPYLTDETGIHANARGSQILAESVAEALLRLYGPRIRGGLFRGAGFQMSPSARQVGDLPHKGENYEPTIARQIGPVAKAVAST